MGRHSAIEWTDHTFNAWEGCEKVSEACKNCYAETRAIRFGHSSGGKYLPLWGPSSVRKFRSAAYWRQPLKWNRTAELAGKRHRVFCMSLGDVFEQLPDDHPDTAHMTAARERLWWDVIENTPWLDWLLLTKRPENIVECLPKSWLNGPPKHNVWLGVTVENQAAVDERIPILRGIPAVVHFVSCEPLLGRVDIRKHLWPACGWWKSAPGVRNIQEAEAAGVECGYKPQSLFSTGAAATLIHWVIAGGESGHGARPTDPKWVHDIRQQCTNSGTPFLFKQWGEWCDADELPPDVWAALEGHGSFENGVPAGSVRIGKKRAGRLLDGRTWDEVPKTKLPPQGIQGGGSES